MQTSSMFYYRQNKLAYLEEYNVNNRMSFFFELISFIYIQRNAFERNIYPNIYVLRIFYEYLKFCYSFKNSPSNEGKKSLFNYYFIFRSFVFLINKNGLYRNKIIFIFFHFFFLFE